MRFLGIPSGSVKINPKYVGHILGIGSEKTGYDSGSLHDISLEELTNLPRLLYDPEVIFRSNTHPNESILLCKEIQGRINPVQAALRINIGSTVLGTSFVLSFYEKNTNPIPFFRDLFNNGFCLYIKDLKKFEAGVRDRTTGPIPIGAVTCTASSKSTFS